MGERYLPSRDDEGAVFEFHDEEVVERWWLLSRLQLLMHVTPDWRPGSRCAHAIRTVDAFEARVVEVVAIVDDRGTTLEAPSCSEI